MQGEDTLPGPGERVPQEFSRSLGLSTAVRGDSTQAAPPNTGDRVSAQAWSWEEKSPCRALTHTVDSFWFRVTQMAVGSPKRPACGQYQTSTSGLTAAPQGALQTRLQIVCRPAGPAGLQPSLMQLTQQSPVFQTDKGLLIPSRLGENAILPSAGVEFGLGHTHRLLRKALPDPGTAGGFGFVFMKLR